MNSKVIRFIPFFFASVLVIKNMLSVLFVNLSVGSSEVSYVVPNSIYVGAIALGIVGFSILLKRTIWSYLFLLTIIASFFPVLLFTSFHAHFSIGSLTIDLIAVAFLVSHILLNPYLIGNFTPSKTEEEETNQDKIDHYTKRFERKTDEELLAMDENDLIPEAVEALNNLIKGRSLN